MNNVYFKATDLYLVKPSVITYQTNNFIKLEQRQEDIDIAIKEDNRYFSIFKKREYENLSKPEFDKYYINVNEEDKILLVRYLYENEIWTDEVEEEIFSIIKYFNYKELEENLNNIKHDNNTIKVKKINLI